MGSQSSQVLQGVPRGSSAELVATHKAWERGLGWGGGRRAEPASRPGCGKRGAPLPEPACPPPWVTTGPPREFKAANEKRRAGLGAGCKRGWRARERAAELCARIYSGAARRGPAHLLCAFCTHGAGRVHSSEQPPDWNLSILPYV